MGAAFRITFEPSVTDVGHHITQSMASLRSRCLKCHQLIRNCPVSQENMLTNIMEYTACIYDVLMFKKKKSTLKEHLYHFYIMLC